MSELKRGIFLDRDGVINRWQKGTTGTDADYYILGWDQFEFLPGVMEAMFQLYTMDYEVFVVSNQSGISKGLTYKGHPVTFKTIRYLFMIMDHEIMSSVRMQVELNNAGCGKTQIPCPEQRDPFKDNDYDNPMVIRDVMFCPHLPEHNCACRKPKPGMIYWLAVRWGIDLSKSWMIGDQDSDISAGYNARIRDLVRIGSAAKEYAPSGVRVFGVQRGKGMREQPGIILPTLLNAVQFIQDVDKWEAR